MAIDYHSKRVLAQLGEVEYATVFAALIELRCKEVTTDQYRELQRVARRLIEAMESQSPE